MKKLAIIALFIILIIAITTGITWFANIPTKQSANASLEVSSLGGNMNVFIDGISKGEIKQSQTKQDFFNLVPGIHKIKLARTDSTVPYFEYEASVNLVNNLSSSINYELGPTSDSTQGWILDYTPKTSSENLLYIYTSEDSKVQVIDSDSKTELVSNPLQNDVYFKISLDKNYTVNITKTSYIAQTFSVFANSSSSELKNYDIVVRSKLFAIPISLDK